MLGLKIKFEKSEVWLILEDNIKLQDYANIFNCQNGKWLMKYFGMPVCARGFTVLEMSFLSEKEDGWLDDGSMSIWGRVTKITACISSTDVYPMSTILLHKTNLEKLENPTIAFLWCGRDKKEKIPFSQMEIYL